MLYHVISQVGSKCHNFTLSTARLQLGALVKPPKPSDQQTRDIEPLLVHCWASVVDGEPTMNQQWLNVSCLLGVYQKKPRYLTSVGLVLGQNR